MSTSDGAMRNTTVKPLRVEARFRNNILFHAIFDRYPTVRAFAKSIGVQGSTVGSLLNLVRSPYRQDGSAIPCAQRVADALQVLVEDLFPRELYATPAPRLVNELEAAALLPLTAARFLPAPERNQDLELTVERMLQTLKPREAEIVRARLGFDGPEMSLREIADAEGVSVERIRQIETRALDRLRHPSRARLLDPVRGAK